jgi:hypothetical protein
MTAREGIKSKYKITIRSPTKADLMSIFKTQSIVETRTAPAKPTNGERINKGIDAPSGMMVSLLRSFSMSAIGWYHGGPTLHWTLADIFLSTKEDMTPKRAENKNPGKTMNLYNISKIIMV